MNYARGLLYLLLFNPCLYGQEEEDTEPFIHLTNHELTLGHETLPYTAITGFCPILREEGKIADLFFIAYELDDEENRPITFVLPGGPGGAGTIQ
ncbi:MAG: S10 family peptidase, partial [uncultured bacterium]